MRCRTLHGRVRVVIWLMLAVLLGLASPLAASATSLAVASLKFTASAAGAGDQFGTSCAKDGDTIIVGCPDGEGHVSNSGVAFIYVASGTGWAQQAKLTAPNGAGSDNFGESVAIDGNIAVVGAPDHVNSGGSHAGSAYVFTRSGSAWAYTAEIKASDAGIGHRFGASVAVDGTTIVVGAPTDDQKATAAGAAYAFTRTDNLWIQQNKMTAGDAETGDQFGFSVGVSGSRAVVGSREEDGKGDKAGAAYIFERSGIVWSQKAEMHAVDGAAFDCLGDSVAIAGSTVVLGAPGNGGGPERVGKAYVFTRNLAGPGVYVWGQQAKISPSDGALRDSFGDSVDIEGDRVVIGAPKSDAMGSDSGSAYTYNRNGTMWTEAYKVVAADGAAGDDFGSSAAIAQGVVAVGARLDDDPGMPDRGSVYVRSANAAPTAVADSYFISMGTQRTVAAPGVLANDYDSDGNSITAVKTSNQAHGTLVFNSNGSFTYKPTAGYVGNDSFKYKAYDGLVYSSIKQVTLVVTDTVAPVATHSAAYSPDLTKVTISATDAGTGVKQIEYKINGGIVHVVTGASAVVDFTQVGTTKLEYRARDKGGHYSFWSTAQVRVKHTQILLNAPSSSAYRSVVVTGYVGYANATGTIEPLAGRTVTIQYKSSGTWKDLAHTTTSATGTFTITLKPSKKTTYRGQFDHVSSYVSGVSAAHSVKPRVSLAKPNLGRTTLKYRKAYTATGNLKPRHPKGSKQIKIKAYRLEGGTYVFKKTYTAKASNKSSYSKYKAKIKLPKRGTWRLVAYHAGDATNAKTTSAARYVTVK